VAIGSERPVRGRWRWLIGWFVGAIVVAAILAGALGAPAAQATATHGATTFDPNTGVITVKVDLIGALGANGNPVTFLNPADGKLETAVQQWQQAVDNTWNGLLNNGGFKRYGYLQSCGKGKPPASYHFTLNLVINPLKAGAAGDPGYHHITLAQVARSNVDSGSRGPGHSDGDGPYVADSKGVWGENHPAFGSQPQGPTTANTIAHEVGHLLGLGDDYNQKTSKPLKGRSGDTIMTNDKKYNKVNQNLVNRIGNQIKKSGHKIPTKCAITYDVYASGFQSLNVTVVDPLNPSYNGSEAISTTWYGSFNNVAVKITKTRRGAIVESKGTALGTFEVEFQYNETGTPYGDPPCSDNFTARFPAVSVFSGGPGASQQLSVLAELSTGAFNKRQLASEMAHCTYAPGFYGPLFAYPALPEHPFLSAMGDMWDAGGDNVAVQDDVIHTRAGSYAPAQALAKGRSFTVNGLYSYSGPCTNQDLDTSILGSIGTESVKVLLQLSFDRQL